MFLKNPPKITIFVERYVICYGNLAKDKEFIHW